MFKMGIKDLQARTYTFEPGDGTHYEFILARDGRNVITASIGGVFFKGKVLSASSVAEFMSQYPAVLCVPEGDYCKYCESSGILEDHFIKYLQEKMECEKEGKCDNRPRCFEYTALAMIICCYFYLLDDLKKSGVIDKVKGVVQDG